MQKNNKIVRPDPTNLLEGYFGFRHPVPRYGASESRLIPKPKQNGFEKWPSGFVSLRQTQAIINTKNDKHLQKNNKSVRPEATNLLEGHFGFRHSEPQLVKHFTPAEVLYIYKISLKSKGHVLSASIHHRIHPYPPIHSCNEAFSIFQKGRSSIYMLKVSKHVTRKPYAL